MEKSWNFAITVSLCKMCCYDSLLVCISKSTTFFDALSCMYRYYNVCVVMIVAVSGGHLYFSK